MNNYAMDLEKYAALARKAAAEGCVLLKNDNAALPLQKGEKVAVFGRIAFDYYKSGLGSGGLVNTRYVVGILDALKAEEGIEVKKELLAVYEAWLKENPYDNGAGWGQVPWSQKEMPVGEEALLAAEGADAAVVVIGRTAGEDQDNTNEPGSYLLTETEEEMLSKVCEAFPRTIVLLNVGNIIDMSWVEKYHPAAVLYVWQGGQEGGNGVCDVLMGRVNPCGKLADTIAKALNDYPSASDFGDPVRNYYKEDIYVGYRYFETFAREKVLYPFGYGLSYTTFSMQAEAADAGEAVKVSVTVTNTGAVAGKEVVQVYVEAPQGKLGKAARALIGFAKTEELAAGESQTLELVIPKTVFASYDDSGVTGHKSCYVLEEGMYRIYAGADVRSAALAGAYEQEFSVVEELEEAYAPVEEFERMKAVQGTDGTLTVGYEKAPLRTVAPTERMKERRFPDIEYTGDKGYKLGDVLDGKVTMDEFVAQLSDDDLICLFRGEGMCSPKVTPGTAAAFGGLTDSLQGFGIPAACVSDGPSGIRMDCGTKAFSLPNGTLLGCTFNLPLVEELYRMTGLELRKNKIDSLLGPGMNIHRHPLNGRNFEYISEDPLLTGKISALQILGMESAGVTGTAKHFCANNQEFKRHSVDAVISERALREIYLRGFEIAVKEGKCRAIMTTYGAVNGIWTAGSYDLNTTILRKEWGFDGLVMTDWWAVANTEGEPGNSQNHAPMVMAQNDVYMVTGNAADHTQDNVKECLENGTVTRGDLQRNAKNILHFIMNVPAMLHKLGRIDADELEAMNTYDEDDVAGGALKTYEGDAETGEIVIDGNDFETGNGKSAVFGIISSKLGIYQLEVTAKSDLNPLAQLPVSVYFDNAFKFTVSMRGSEGKWITETRDFGFIHGPNHYVKLYFGADGLVIDKIVLKPIKIVTMEEFAAMMAQYQAQE